MWGRAMRRLFRTLLQLLDGTPAVYGPMSRGQSVAELALVTPILIVLIMGLAEVGWFTNNFLILLETTRVGARLGTTLVAESSPLSWNNLGSRSHVAFPADAQPYPPGPAGYTTPEHYRDCERELVAFYTRIACNMKRSVEPLSFRDGSIGGLAANGIDDIIISGFAVHAVDPDNPDIPTSMKNDLALVTGLPNDVPQAIVVGRYPVNANECTVDNNGNPAVRERDPFDYIDDGLRNYVLIDTLLPDTPENQLYFELEGMDAPAYPAFPTGPTTRERQVGYSWAGQHYISETNNQCVGSEWTIGEIQQLMNNAAFIIVADPTAREAQRDRIPSQGVVLVEMFWEHELLLKNPVFNPVFTILGDRTTVTVWAAFPLPTVEPRIRYRVDG
jgi:hypothetical protein